MTPVKNYLKWLFNNKNISCILCAYWISLSLWRTKEAKQSLQKSSCLILVMLFFQSHFSQINGFYWVFDSMLWYTYFQRIKLEDSNQGYVESTDPVRGYCYPSSIQCSDSWKQGFFPLIWIINFFQQFS